MTSHFSGERPPRLVPVRLSQCVMCNLLQVKHLAAIHAAVSCEGDHEGDHAQPAPGNACTTAWVHAVVDSSQFSPPCPLKGRV
jgi:hypothetical protein